MSVRELIEEIIRIEGGYVDHKADKGGPTCFGITIKTLEAWRGKKLTSNDVKNLEKWEAYNIYAKEYYQAPGIDKLPELLQPVAFDMAVNMGPTASIKLIQKVIHRLGTPISIDGKIGPMTAQSAKSACLTCKGHILMDIADARKDYYRDIVARDGSQGVFLAGWINRADLFKYQNKVA